MRVSPPTTRYADEESIRAYYAQVVERLEAAPGVNSVSMINILPMGSGNIGLLYDVEDNPLPDGSRRPRANARTISPGYFSAMGIPVLQGRELQSADADDELIRSNRDVKLLVEGIQRARLLEIAPPSLDVQNIIPPDIPSGARLPPSRKFIWKWVSA